MRRRTWIALAALAVLVAAVAILWRRGRAIWYPVYRAVAGKLTVEGVVRDYGPAAEARLKPHFDKAGVEYPPTRLALLTFKEEKRLELWAGKGSGWAFVRSYPILAASGGPGPKLRQGDRQVPEGLYRIVSLNPNSSYHLSMKLDYPNAFDRARAKEDGRTGLGGDIFLHGKDVSIGCIALGDPAIEELFVLVARVGMPNVTVLISPHDLRQRPAAMPENAPRWLPGLYERLGKALADFPSGK